MPYLARVAVCAAAVHSLFVSTLTLLIKVQSKHEYRRSDRFRSGGSGRRRRICGNTCPIEESHRLSRSRRFARSIFRTLSVCQKGSSCRSIGACATGTGEPCWYSLTNRCQSLFVGNCLAIKPLP